MKVSDKKTKKVWAEHMSPCSKEELAYKLFIEPALMMSEYVDESKVIPSDFNIKNIAIDYTKEERKHWIQSGIAKSFSGSKTGKGSAALTLAGINNDATCSLFIVVAALINHISKNKADIRLIADEVSKISGISSLDAMDDVTAIAGLSTRILKGELSMPFIGKSGTVRSVLDDLGEANAKIIKEID